MNVYIEGPMTKEKLTEAFELAQEQYSKRFTGARCFGASVEFQFFDGEGVSTFLSDPEHEQHPLEGAHLLLFKIVCE